MRKSFSRWAIKICQNQGFISSPLSGKNMTTFCNIWAIFARKNGGAGIRGLGSKFDKTYFIHTIPVKIFQFYGYRLQRTFQKSFNLDFQAWLLFLMQTLMLNHLAPISNPKITKITYLKSRLRRNFPTVQNGQEHRIKPFFS